MKNVVEFKKNANVVMATPIGDISLKGQDRTLFNYLLARAYNEMAEGITHEIAVKDVLEYLKIDRTTKLLESLTRLGHATINIKYMENDEDREIIAHYLSVNFSKAENGVLKYAFDPILVQFQMDPKVYSLINIDRIRDLKQLPSITLYEIMQLHYHKMNPEWTINVDSLRSLFGITEHPRFDNFKKNVIEKAITEVNAIASFDIEVDYIKGGKGGSIIAVKFTAVSKTHKRFLETRDIKSLKNKRSIVTDKNTIDLLDGMSFEERGGPAEIQQSTIDSLMEKYKDNLNINVQDLLIEWRKKFKGTILKNPDETFNDWIKLKIEKENDEIMKEIDDDIFGSLLEGN